MSDISQIHIAEALKHARQQAGLTQQELAARAGTSQPAVARLERGQGSPAVATLQRLANAAGFDLYLELVPKSVPDPVIQAYKRDVDRTLLRENLRRTPDQRLRMLARLQEETRELQRAVRRQRRAT